MFQAVLMKSTNPNKKFSVYIENNKTIKKIDFGAKGMSDYTIHKNDARKNRYIERHMKRENWNDPFTAGFWSLRALWNKKTLDESLKDIEKNYDIEIENMS